MKKEWPAYLASSAAAQVAKQTRDLMEFLDGLRRENRLVKDFKQSLGRVVYHAACHLRAQKIATPGARVLAQIPETDVRIVERCSAVDGTWGMKAAYYEEGARYADKLKTAIAEQLDADPVTVVTDCSLAALRIKKENGLIARHPVVALAAAYGLEDA
jgi:glycerol-3-phosphate dehydrogenase subunit C